MSSPVWTVIVTGGARGLGKSIATAFLGQGHNVAIADIDQASSSEFTKWAADNGYDRRLLSVLCNVSDENSVQNLVEKVMGHFNTKSLNVVVNNAAIANPYYKTTENSKPAITGMSLDTWMSYMNVNLTSAFLLSKHAIPHMKGESTGSIINIASTRALMSEPDSEAYAASKGGLVAFSHALAVSCAGTGIRVNTVVPGWIDTTGSDTAYGPGLQQADHDQHPAGRVGLPRDIAEMVLFLADDEKSGFITGQEFVVDGGMTRKMIYTE
jgi:NAD(P)-dependent dehydrogenase (short-subunit alcohol dehydrogenase family)